MAITSVGTEGGRDSNHVPTSRQPSIPSGLRFPLELVRCIPCPPVNLSTGQRIQNSPLHFCTGALLRFAPLRCPLSPSLVPLSSIGGHRFRRFTRPLPVSLGAAGTRRAGSVSDRCLLPRLVGPFPFTRRPLPSIRRRPACRRLTDGQSRHLLEFFYPLSGRKN